jgi:hypothetical protein
VTIRAGTLTGLLSGSRAEVHSETARKASPGTLLAQAKVFPRGLLNADLKLDHSLPEEVLYRSRVFITEHSFGSLRISVQLKDLAPEVRSQIAATFQRVSALKLVEAQPDIIIQPLKKPPGTIEVLKTADGYRLLTGVPVSERGFGERIGSRLLDYARSRYMRGVQIKDDEFKVRLEMVPVRVERCRDPKQPTEKTCTVTPMDLSSKKIPGGGYVWRSEEFFKLRVKNESPKPAYLNILQLGADGTIQQLWPRPGTSDKTTLGSDRSQDLRRLYQFSGFDQRGTEELLLIATEQFVDFEPFVTQESLNRGEPRGKGPFAPLFDDNSVRGETKVFYPEEAVNTSAITLTVCPAKDTKCRP